MKLNTVKLATREYPTVSFQNCADVSSIFGLSNKPVTAIGTETHKVRKVRKKEVYFTPLKPIIIDIVRIIDMKTANKINFVCEPDTILMKSNIFLIEENIVYAKMIL